VVGPHALGLAPDSEGQKYLAEFGVVFLMFYVGLEFSLPQLMGMRRAVLGLGSSEVAAVMALGIGLAMAAGLSWREGIIVGGVASMSSTAIVSKALAERLQLHSDYGRAVMGVLLFQDLAVIPLLVVIPALGGSSAEIASAIGVALVKAVVILAVALYLGQRLMRPLFDLVARQKSSELFVLFVLLVALGLAYVTQQAGLSLALGAFLAGMLISETEYRYQVADYVKPFRDVLLGLFFVTIGMLLDPRVLVAHLGAVVGVFALLIVGKAAVIFVLARAFGAAKPTALRGALALAPAGEFGFVLIALADRGEAMGEGWLQILLAASLLSMLTAPLILARMERIVLYLVSSEWEQRALELHNLAVKSMATRGHVIVCGYGRSGQALTRYLEREKLSVMALDSDPERVREAAAAGDSVVFGDAARREVLVAAALSRAAAVVVSFADTPKALAILAHVRSMRPELPVIVRTFDDSDVVRLKEAGAAEIVAEVVEGSLMLATQTMMQLGIPLNRVLRGLRDVRAERYAIGSGFFPGVTDLDGAGGEQPRLHSVHLGPEAAAVGLTLGALNLDALGVRVSAVRRMGAREVNPSAATQLKAGDVVVLLGPLSQLARAEIRLLQG
ncbi:MAG TPA: cation:proton antiporter, partial [Usitatibacter sp.]|nr:cation:proton antiporter [Usitatibacter sp.]